MRQEEFDKEAALCKKLYHENQGGCHWGRCKACGVLPLLYKMSTGKVLENDNEIRALKKRVFGDEQYL